MTSSSNDAVVQAAQLASAVWAAAFNRDDALGCASAYESDAVMHATAFGTFRGHTEIKSFWESLIGDGYAGVAYINPKIEVIDSNSAVLSADWSMNKTHGVITREFWVLQDDGTAKLREDAFEALPQQSP